MIFTNLLNKFNLIFFLIFFLFASKVILSDDTNLDSQNISLLNIYEKDFKNAEDQSKYREIIKSIRCPVCQGQSIADSNADIAVDLKFLVKKMVLDGYNNEQIEEFILARYGDYLLLKPRFSQGFILWLAPLFFLAIMIFILFRIITRRSKTISNQNNLT